MDGNNLCSKQSILDHHEVILQNLQTSHFNTWKLKWLPLFTHDNHEYNAYIQKNQAE